MECGVIHWVMEKQTHTNTPTPVTWAGQVVILLFFLLFQEGLLQPVPQPFHIQHTQTQHYTRASAITLKQAATAIAPEEVTRQAHALQKPILPSLFRLRHELMQEAVVLSLHEGPQSRH